MLLQATRKGDFMKQRRGKKALLGAIIFLLAILTAPFSYAATAKGAFVPTRDVMALVKPSILYGTMKTKDNEVWAGAQVEILRDINGGQKYLVKIGKRTAWVKGTSLSIPPDPETNTDRLTDEELVYYVNQMGFSSGSGYFVWVDIDRQMLNVFTGSQKNWKLVKSISCATGKNVTPTLRGTFTSMSYGESFGSYNREGAKYYVSYYGDYMIHSLPYLHNKVSDYTVGKRASHGCVRIAVTEAQWFYRAIPRKTTIWIN